METQQFDIERIRQLLHVYRVPLGLGIISLVCIVISIFLLFSARQSASTTFTLGVATDSGAVRSRTITVDVAGAVVHPGVYTLGEGARIEDAVAAAGGFADTVSTTLVETSINRAARINDGGKVYIPTKNDGGESETSRIQKVQRLDIKTSHILNNAQTGSLVSINNASQQDLEALPGVGPVTATKIITGRPYTGLEQLLEKKVIGQKLFDNIRTQITL